MAESPIPPKEGVATCVSAKGFASSLSFFARLGEGGVWGMEEVEEVEECHQRSFAVGPSWPGGLYTATAMLGRDLESMGWALAPVMLGGGAMVQWCNDAKVQLCKGAMVQWCNCARVQCIVPPEE